MKLSLPNINIERSEDFKEYNFTIGNEALVVDILRSKMYHNPIKTICQEIVSNARDAHREIGDTTTPITVFMPSSFDMSYTVQDFGPGMSIDRIENVYTKYAVSTKNDSNDQTGGFGLGAKSPWAYTDSFYVETIADEPNGFRYKSKYAAFIGEGNQSKLALLSREKTNEHTGTSVTVPVKTQSDRSRFESYTFDVCNYWDLQPNYKNTQSAEQTEFTKLPFCIIKKHYQKYGSDRTILVDDIPYVLSSVNNNTNIIQSIPRSVVLSFDTGELSLSATREAIEDNEANLKAIEAKIENYKSHIDQYVQDQLKSSQSLSEACYKYLSYKHLCIDTNTTDGVSFQGLSLAEVCKAKHIDGAKVYTYRTRYGHTHSENGGYFYIDEYFKDVSHKAIIFNDISSMRPSIGRIKSVLDAMPSDSTVFCIHPNQGKPELIDDIKKQIFYKQLPWKNLSDYQPIKRARSGGSSSGPTTNCINFAQGTSASANVSLSSLNGYYVSTFLDRIDDGDTLHYMSFSNCYTLCSVFNIKIYGIPRRFVKTAQKNCTHLSEWLKAQVQNITKDFETINILDLFSTYRMLYDQQFNHLFSRELFADEVKKLIENDRYNNNRFVKYLKRCEQFKSQKEYQALKSLVGFEHILRYLVPPPPTTTTSPYNDIKQLYQTLKEKLALLIFAEKQSCFYNRPSECDEQSFIDQLIQIITKTN